MLAHGQNICRRSMHSSIGDFKKLFGGGASGSLIHRQTSKKRRSEPRFSAMPCTQKVGAAKRVPIGGKVGLLTTPADPTIRGVPGDRDNRLYSGKKPNYIRETGAIVPPARDATSKRKGGRDGGAPGFKAKKGKTFNKTSFLYSQKCVGDTCAHHTICPTNIGGATRGRSWRE